MAASPDVTAVFDADAAPAGAMELAAPADPAALAPASAPGFAVRLPRAQLGDLIQINCLNRIRGAFRVSSSQGEGHLFFEGGLLVHAACGEQTGLDAVVSMLGWRGGTIEPCEPAWPAQSSIGMGADALLLHAAQRLDERMRDASQRDSTTKVVRRVPHPEPSELEPELSRRSEQSGIALMSPLGLDGLARLEVTRVASDGKIERMKAGGSTDLADTAFYCQRLAALVGDGLGIGPCRALACEGATEGLVVFQGRSIVGARGQLEDLKFVLAKVGLG